MYWTRDSDGAIQIYTISRLKDFAFDLEVWPGGWQISRLGDPHARFQRNHPMCYWFIVNPTRQMDRRTDRQTWWSQYLLPVCPHLRNKFKPTTWFPLPKHSAIKNCLQFQRNFHKAQAQIPSLWSFGKGKRPELHRDDWRKCIKNVY